MIRLFHGMHTTITTTITNNGVILDVEGCDQRYCTGDTLDSGWIFWLCLRQGLSPARDDRIRQKLSESTRGSCYQDTQHDTLSSETISDPFMHTYSIHPAHLKKIAVAKDRLRPR